MPFRRHLKRVKYYMGIFRFILAYSVVFTHLRINALIGGQLAVQSFFLVSGFLITHVLLAKGRYTSIRNFFLSRFYRLYPIYIFILFLSFTYSTLISEGKSLANLDISNSPNESLFILFITNLFIIGQDVVMFLQVQGDGVSFTGNFHKVSNPLYLGLFVPQAWSLSLEIYFYLLAPFILRRKKILYLILFFSIFLRMIGIMLGFGANDPWSYRFFPFELALFLIGSIVRLESYKILRPNYLLGKILLCLLICCIIFFPQINYSNEIKGPIYLMLVITSLPSMFSISRKIRKFDSFLGDLSYPIYLVHILVIAIFDNSRIDSDSSVGKLACIFVTFVLSVFINIFIAKPIENYRNRFKFK